MQRKPQITAPPRRGSARFQPDALRRSRSGGIANYFKRLAGFLGFLLLLLPCIFAGMYAGVLNTSTWFSFLVFTGTVAGLGTGLGVGLMEASAIMLWTGKAGRSYLKRAEIPKRFTLAFHIRNFLLAMSEEKRRMISVLIIGSMAPAYWIARPLYIFSIFDERLPEYVALAWGTPPSMFVVERDTTEEENCHAKHLSRGDCRPGCELGCKEGGPSFHLFGDTREFAAAFQPLQILPLMTLSTLIQKKDNSSSELPVSVLVRSGI